MSSWMNKLYHGNSERMDKIPEKSVHLVVTSPPYNVGKEYEEEKDFNDYMESLYYVWLEVRDKLVDGARVAINIANIQRHPVLPVVARTILDMNRLGFLFRGDIVWVKSVTAGRRTSWGSWMSASNPVIRDEHEYILVFSYKTWSRQAEDRKNSTMDSQQFMSYTKSVWNMRTVSAKRIGHPAPFPVELPYRLINMYTYEGDVVLDPYMGSGTTAIAAESLGRNWVGYEREEKYIDLARRRIEKARVTQLNLI